MIRLTYSNRSEALLEALVEDLSAWRASGANPLEPVRVVVPNRNVETWLKQGLARRTGLAANLEIHYLQRFVAGLLGEGRRLLDGEAILDGILGLFLDEARLGEAAYAGLRSYLQAAGEAPAAVDNRRFQLALQLARLFEEYSYARPDMVVAWEQGQTLVGTSYEETERWQRRLWLDVLRASEGATHLPGVLEEAGAFDPGERPIFLFGISYVATAFHRILGLLAQRGRLHAYTLNPCREFWEDVETGREFARRLKRVGRERLEEEDPFGLLAGNDTPALALWGRPGRENIRLLNELADCDFIARFEEPQGQGLLHQIQRDILERAPERTAPDPAFDFEGDASLEILACPGVRREAEAIAAEIWSMIRADPTLRFNDIAVLVAGKDAQGHFSHLRAVFDESHRIPYSLGDVPFSAESRVAEAVELLVQLPLGGFTRSELLRFLTHPAVGGRFAEALPEDWAALTERLGIVLGVDREQLAESYLEQDLLTWDQGLRRLALGSFVGGEADHPEPCAFGEAQILPEQGEEGELAWAAMVRSLLSDLRFARDAKMKTRDWARFFDLLARTYVRAEDEAASRELERCLRSLRGLGELSLGDEAISCRLAVQFALRGLQALSGGKGHYLADGVVLSTLQPMRAIPFRAIFIAGLGEGRFPSVEKRSHLDLRLARPRAGDVSTRDGEQYMFLETLLCARDRLVLSYVARDAQTGDELPPSPVVAELRRMIERGYVKKAPVRRIALRRFDSEGADRCLSPQALREGEALALRQGLVEALGAEARLLSARSIVERAAPEERDRLAGLLGLHPVPEPPKEEKSEPRTLSVASLRRFLECPLQGSAKYLLRLEEDEEDLLDRELEHFETPRLQRTVFLRARFFEALAEAGSAGAVDGGLLERLYDRAALREVLAGRAPSGLFHRAERREHLAQLQAWAEACRELGLERVRTLRFGGATVEMSADEVLEAINLGTARVTGKTEALAGGGGASLLLVNGAPKGLGRNHLRVFLDRVLLSAAGLETERAHEGWFAHATPDPGVARQPFAPISQDEARRYLQTLAEDMLSPPRGHFLPCEAVFEWGLREDKRLTEVTAKLRDNGFGSCSSDYGPVRAPRSFPILEEEEARELVVRRFGLFFEKLLPVEGKPRGKK